MWNFLPLAWKNSQSCIDRFFLPVIGVLAKNTLNAVIFSLLIIQFTHSHPVNAATHIGATASVVVFVEVQVGTGRGIAHIQGSHPIGCTSFERRECLTITFG